MERVGFLKRFERKLRWKRMAIKKIAAASHDIYNLAIANQSANSQLQAKNPLNQFGRKCFSQSDEDGITLEILKRIGSLSAGVFAEFGVGDGMENNSIILKAMRWKGFWVGGEDLKPKIGEANDRRFAYLKAWVTRQNIIQLAQRGLEAIDESKIDVISFDLDGNDIYFIEDLLAADFRPKLFIVEYNAKFPPPVEFRIQYNAEHVWALDDYYGASLASFIKVFNRFDYRLICCNSHTGCNAFFVRNEYSSLFPDVPADIDSIYMPPQYLVQPKYGHPQSVRTIEEIFRQE
jgi:hypothetical protein